MMHYITVSVISLGFLFALYMAILKREKSFRFNRCFLLCAVILCLITPLLEFSAPKALPAIPTIDIQLFENSQIEDDAVNFQNVEVIHKQNPISLQIFILLYAIITLLLIFRFGKHLFQMIKLLKTVAFKINGMNVIYTEQKNNSYSFFNNLFIHQDDFFQYQNFNAVLEHELVHSRQLHSIDVIVMEIISCFFWFNPFIWLFKKELFLNHEFLADQGVIEAGMSLDDYSKTIIHSGDKYLNCQLSSGFNFIQTKNRIIMLHHLKSSFMKQSIKILAALVLFLAVFAFTAFRDNKPQLVVVIDAGHGGRDSGTLEEKDVVLQISRILATYSDKRIKIIETRATDKFLTFNERIDFINKHNPDLVITLHCNAHKQKTSLNGVSALYYADNDFNEKSQEYSKTLVENQLDLFSDRGTVKSSLIYMLKNINCPGVYLEMGYLTNKNDRAILLDEKHQKTIAKSLYESLLKIREYNSN